MLHACLGERNVPASPTGAVAQVRRGVGVRQPRARGASAGGRRRPGAGAPPPLRPPWGEAPPAPMPASTPGQGEVSWRRSGTRQPKRGGGGRPAAPPLAGPRTSGSPRRTAAVVTAASGSGVLVALAGRQQRGDVAGGVVGDEADAAVVHGEGDGAGEG